MESAFILTELVVPFNYSSVSWRVSVRAVVQVQKIGQPGIFEKRHRTLNEAWSENNRHRSCFIVSNVKGLLRLEYRHDEGKDT